MSHHNVCIIDVHSAGWCPYSRVHLCYHHELVSKVRCLAHVHVHVQHTYDVWSHYTCRAVFLTVLIFVIQSFHGKHGRAYLFGNVVNVSRGPKEDRILMTGLHTVCDIYCSSCHTNLGWTYVSVLWVLIILHESMCDVMWCDVVMCDVVMMWCDVMIWCDVMWCDVMWYF